MGGGGGGVGVHKVHSYIVYINVAHTLADYDDPSEDFADKR